MTRTINDIIPPSRRRMMGESAPAPTASEPVDMTSPVAPPPITPPSMPPLPKPYSPNSRKFPFGTAIVALLVVLASGGALYFFSGAKVEVAPAQSPLTIDAALTATASSGDLPFEVVSVQKTASASVPAESTATVNDPAQGSITILNAQSVPQPLVTNTRFATPDGKVFRIHSAVTVPAGTTGNPGSATVTAFADQGGDSSNIAPTTFTLPGLKGGKSYTLVTAKSTSAFTGGFSGSRPSVSAATDAQQQATLKATLATDLASAIASKVPAGYVLVPGSTFSQFSPQADTAGAGGTVAINVSGTLSAVVFPREALAKAIAYKSQTGYSGQPVTLADVSKLTLTPENPDVAPLGQPTFSFNLTGGTTIHWIIDKTRIASAVAGKTRDAAQATLKSLQEVDTAVVILRPFWVQTFPQDPTKIQVSTTTTSGAKS